jgi:hypothetical protein
MRFINSNKLLSAVNAVQTRLENIRNGADLLRHQGEYTQLS